MSHESQFGVYKCKRDTSFSKQVLLDAWKAKNTSLKQPNKQDGHTEKEERIFS